MLSSSIFFFFSLTKQFPFDVLDAKLLPHKVISYTLFEVLLVFIKIHKCIWSRVSIDVFEVYVSFLFSVVLFTSSESASVV